MLKTYNLWPSLNGKARPKLASSNKAGPKPGDKRLWLAQNLRFPHNLAP